MIFRALDEDGDWSFGTGRQSFLTAEAAVELNAATRLRSFLNDCFWATDFGVDWWNLLGAKNPAAQANVLLQVRASLGAAYGIVRIDSVVAATDSRTRRVSIKAVVDTIFSRGVTITVQP